MRCLLLSMLPVLLPLLYLLLPEMLLLCVLLLQRCMLLQQRLLLRGNTGLAGEVHARIGCRMGVAAVRTSSHSRTLPLT